MWTLKLEAAFKERLWTHLLPEVEEAREQAAFLYCKTSSAHDGTIEVFDSEFMTSEDFAAQCSDYLELSDEARLRLIKRAHVLGAFLAEFHSHPWNWPAEFSWSDRKGLRETVPHMKWRLKQRPYVAVVVARTSYDALIWQAGDMKPEPLSGIEVSGVLDSPTNRSLGGWDD